MNVIDLFSGCGGLSLGAHKAGMNVIAAFDNWAPAITCYRANFNHPIYKLDLTDPKSVAENIYEILDESETSIDAIIGGPPCQDFSQAGQRNEGLRANLTASFATTVSIVSPRFFIMENVDRAMKSKAYAEARAIFKKAGYGLTEVVLDASKCNVPQKRKRSFIIGCLNSPDNFLLAELIGALNESPMTVRDYLGNKLGLEYYYRHPRNYNRRGIFSIDEPAPTVRGVNRPVPKGYTGHTGDPVPLDSSVRPLTTKERALLQTFPESFVLTGSKTDNEQMIGNAVPVNLGAYVCRHLMEFSRHNENESGLDTQVELCDVE